LVCDNEDEIIEELPKSAFVAADVLVDAGYEFRYLVDDAANGDTVVRQEDEQRFVTANLVGHLSGRARELVEFKLASYVSPADPVVQLGPDCAGIAQLDLALEDLSEVGLCEEAQRGSWPVVQVRGPLLEALPSILDEP
jgi:hypothetical protein